MKKLLLTLISLIFYSMASYATLGPLTPASGTICIGSPFYVSETDTVTGGGGVWTSSNSAIATVTSSGTYYGTVTGISTGVVTITYTVGSSYVTATYTVNTVPASITGPTSTCAGYTITLADATPGGTWSGSGWATVNSTTGVVTGVGYGDVNIYYTVGGCSESTTIMVTGILTGPISGPTAVCPGSTITVIDTSVSFGGFTWSSSNTAIATVGASTGIVTGVSAGTATITFSLTTSCGTTDSTMVITVGGSATPGTISGSGTVTTGLTTPLTVTGGTGAWTGGTWSSSNTTIATVGTTGIVTGVSPGSAIITYSISTCGGTVLTCTANITVTSLNGISGHVIFSSGYTGAVKVWLITYNTSTFDLEAVDSTSVFCSGTSVYYQFTGLTTDSFRVKASINADTGVAGNYIPTYHDSSYYWDSANVIDFITGASDLNEDINMLAGTATTGPGFIGGNVYTGANRGTSGSIPVAGLDIIALNSLTGAVVSMTTTDSSGNYSFSNLPYGTYTIFPDSLNYATYAYTNITISASSPSVTGAGFIQHTVSNTITPITEAVKNIAATTSSVSAFPNPTNGRLNIQWTENVTEKSTISISDVTGRSVYNTTVNMTQGSGMTAIDLSTFTNGVYMISIKSASLNYNSKIEVLH